MINTAGYSWDPKTDRMKIMVPKIFHGEKKKGKFTKVPIPPPNANKVCMNDENAKVSKKKLAILQLMKNQRIPGYKCKVKRSSWQLYCGTFSHERLIAIPQIEINLPVSIAQCETLVTTNQYSTDYGTQHQVPLGEETVFSVSELGVNHTETNGKVWCEGQTLKI